VKSKNGKKLAKLAVSGFVDVVANFAGPLGAAAGMVSSVFDFWETQSAAQQLEDLAGKILEEAEKMISASNYNNKIKEIANYVQGFASEFSYYTATVNRIAKSTRTNGGMTQFLFLNALQSDIATTKYQWLEFAQGEACHARNGDPNDDACAALRNSLTMAVPALLSMHLALLDMMATAIVSLPDVATEVRGKFYEQAQEYEAYTDKFTHSQCNGYENMPTNKAGKITVCVRDYFEMIRVMRLWSGNRDGCLKYELRQLERQGRKLGYIQDSLMQANATAGNALAGSRHPVMRELHAICNGFECLHKGPTLEQSHALKAHAHEVARRAGHLDGANRPPRR